MEDKTLKCRDCSTDFTWPVREQEFFQKLGYAQPRRCYSCRKMKKAAKEAAAQGAAAGRKGEQ